MSAQHRICLSLLTLCLSACGDSPGSNTGTNVTVNKQTKCIGSTANPARLFLQQVGSTSAIIKWCGDANNIPATGNTCVTDPVTLSLCFGTDPDNLTQDSLTEAVITETNHAEATLTGLAPDTLYYYSVGAAGSTDAKYAFRTAPTTGNLPEDGNIRLWIVGDSGTGDANAEAVRDGYKTWRAAHGGEKEDLFLMLGDNAYLDGSDALFQGAVFEMYPDVLAGAAMWPTIGNHEMGSSGLSFASTPDSYVSPSDPAAVEPAGASRMPYLNIHTLPTQGELGGIPSGTEQYYSFDYGNVHVISLDSQLSARDETQRATMLQWLVQDLEANSSDWTIVMFHHPPYTKASHDSDDPIAIPVLGVGIDQPIFDMREEFTPIFDKYAVDLVYSGHSHAYERSYYIHGHTGLSDTFDKNAHAELNDAGEPANGREDEDGAYGQVSKSGADDKVVYTVAGSSGQIGGTSAGFPHPAHYYSDPVLGSVVIDATANQLNVYFVDVNGDTLDYYSMTR